MRLLFNTSLPVWFIEKLDSRLECFNIVLAQGQCADVAIWVYDSQERWTLHIIEAKETVDVSSSSRGWGHIKKQFLGALLRCRMLAGIFGIHFDQVIFYTAFVNDHITPRSKPKTEEYDTEDTTLFRVVDDTSSPWSEWQTGECHIESPDLQGNYTEQAYAHRQILLESSTLESKDTVRL
ncbi:MAG: hypothetical protein LBI05_04925 [Planctomycetaceae bacterium]|nr:hypothetical protein [Planctomycetaceae bacterium]